MVSPSRADAWKSRGRGCWGDSWQDCLVEPTVLCSLSQLTCHLYAPTPQPPAAHPILTFLRSHPLPLGKLPHLSEQPLQLSPLPPSQAPTSQMLPTNLA